MLFTANRIKACCTGYKSKSLRIYSPTKKRNQESRNWYCLWQTNGWPTQYVARHAIRSLMQSRKSKKNGILDVFFVQNNGLFSSCNSYIKHLIHVLFFPHAVHVEMKGKHGFLSASDWPLYPVMMLQLYFKLCIQIFHFVCFSLVRDTTIQSCCVRAATEDRKA